MSTHRLAIVGILATLSLGTLGWSVASRESADRSVVEPTAASVYGVDPVHSSVIFRIKHAGVTNFYGRFDKMTGSWSFDPDDLSTASFEFEIDNASVNTGANNRNDHLKSADFFNVKQFPTTSFKSTKLEAVSGSMYTLTGELTLHGETHAVTAALEYLGEGSFRDHDLASFEAIFTINRRDFGMTTYSAADGSDTAMLGNTVKIIISVEGPKQ